MWRYCVNSRMWSDVFYDLLQSLLSASSNAVFFETKLIGPMEKIQGGEPSYPYIVIKTEYRDGPVQFQ